MIERLQPVKRDDRRHAVRRRCRNRQPARVAVEHHQVAVDCVLAHPPADDEGIDERRPSAGDASGRRKIIRRHDRDQVAAAPELGREILLGHQHRGLLILWRLQDDGDLPGHWDRD